MLAADVLVSLADEHGADVIVVGNKGMQRILLGSVTNSAAHRAGRSVYVVKTTSRAQTSASQTQ